jgi:predicted ATPase with chaperone activity
MVNAQLAALDDRAAFQPPEPKSVAETGLNIGYLADLVLKVLYFQGNMAGADICDVIKLPFIGVVDQVTEFLKREQMVEVKGGAGLNEAAYRLAITNKGSGRAREVMDRGQYVGPAPIPVSAYNKAIRRQTARHVTVNPQTVRSALSHLVLDDMVFDQIGPAVNSGRSIFLFGPPGNGKTSIAESMGRIILNDDILIPYAMEVDGQVIKIYDDVNHVRVEENKEQDLRRGAGSVKIDQRWVKIRRPVIIVGGELTLEGLDLVFDDAAMYYEAPFQLKANGGMFLIDDFGRQLVRPRDLLNRWIVPLEKRIDYLTLRTGRKIDIPFEVLIVFSTNLEPRDLVDEAFLRRIRYKIEINDPSFEHFREIFRRVCRSRKVGYDEQGLAYLLQEYYLKPKAKLRACHPRDIIDELLDIASYHEVEPRLTPELIDLACKNYFVTV